MTDTVDATGEIDICIDERPIQTEVTVPLSAHDGQGVALAFSHLYHHFNDFMLKFVQIVAINVEYINIDGEDCIRLTVITRPRDINFEKEFPND